MAWDGVLIRFGEIGIKSPPVRRQMLDRLTTNIQAALEREGLEGSVIRSDARLWLTGPDVPALTTLATRVFGIVSVSPARKVAPTMETMSQAAIDVCPGGDWKTFGIRASRDGDHDFTSQDIGRVVGSAVYKAREAAGHDVGVDLSNPEVEVHVDARRNEAYVYAEKFAGPGGLPLGTQGKVGLLLSDADSGVAGWLLMRRGCALVPIHAGDTGSVPLELVEALAAWGMPRRVDVLPVCSGSTSKVTLLEAAAQVARDRGAVALATGDGLSSDLRGIPNMAVLRPLAGLHPDEAARWAGVAQMPDVDASPIFADASSETKDSLLSMRRTVEA